MGKLTWKAAKLHLDFSFFFLFSSFTMTIILKFPFPPFPVLRFGVKVRFGGCCCQINFLGRIVSAFRTMPGDHPCLPRLAQAQAWGSGGLSAQPWCDCHDQGPSLRLAQPRHHSDTQECVLKGCTMNFCLSLFW